MSASVQFDTPFENIGVTVFDTMIYLDDRKVKFVYESKEVRLSLIINLPDYINDILDDDDFLKVQSLIDQRLAMLEADPDKANKLEVQITEYLTELGISDELALERIHNAQGDYGKYLSDFASEFKDEIIESQNTSKLRDEEVFVEIYT